MDNSIQQQSDDQELISDEEQEDAREEEEEDLDDGHGNHGTTNLAPTLFDARQHAPHQVHYQLKTENGQVTYRVVQVQQQQQSSEHNESNNMVSVSDVHAPSLPLSSGISSAQSAVAQAILATHAQHPFQVQASSSQDSSNSNLLSNVNQTTSSSSSGGPFYVMMTPTQELVSTQRSIQREGVPRVARDEKRRATHNEVERRRRDKINSWIIKLAKVVPDCAQDHTKQGQSKGGILAKATEYIQELSLENSRMQEVVKENELLSNELDSVRSQFVDAKNENRKLRALLVRHGISFSSGTQEES